MPENSKEYKSDEQPNRYAADHSVVQDIPLSCADDHPKARPSCLESKSKKWAVASFDKKKMPTPKHVKPIAKPEQMSWVNA